jgi:regulator of RNase E activity RraA
MEEISNRYKRFYSGLIFDIMEEMGMPHQALATDIRPLLPDVVIAAPAFTVQMVNDPTGDPDLREKRIRMFKEMTYPCIDIRDAGFDTRAAHYGEMNATLGAKFGCVGAVIDGGTRDSRHINERGFPVFARYQTPVEALGRSSYFRWQVPITIRGAITATVTVNPGDFIFGDIDGLISIPKDAVLEVLDRCEELYDRENHAREEFRAGDPEAVYRKYGRL